VPSVRTPTHHLADLLLGGDGELERFVRSRRADGKSWRIVERELYEEHDLDITHVSLRTWFPDKPSEAVG
jgi:hypothetical protein